LNRPTKNSCCIGNGSASNHLPDSETHSRTIMNKIYSKVWNKALGQLVVASELVSNNIAGATGTAAASQRGIDAVFSAGDMLARNGVKAKPLPLSIFSSSGAMVLLATLYMAVSAPVFAGNGIFINDGTDSACLWTYDTAGLGQLGNYGGSNPNPLAGNSSPLGGQGASTPVPTTAQLGAASAMCATGDKATQTNRALFYGPATGAGSTSLTLGGDLYANGGNFGLGGGQAGSTAGSMRIGSAATLAGTSGTNSIAIGGGTIATQAIGQGSIALGNASRAGSAGSLGFGDTANANGAQSIAMGSNTYSNSTGAVALGGNSAAGLGAQALANGAVAIGANVAAGASAAGTDSIALAGQSSVAAAANAGIAIGRKATVTARGGIAQGDTATSSALNAIALGASSVASGAGSTAIGSDSTRGAHAVASNAIAIGAATNVTSTNGIAIGLQAVSTSDGEDGYSSIAIGAHAVGQAEASVALGDGAQALDSTNAGNGAGAVAVGAGSLAQGDGTDDDINASSPTAVGRLSKSTADGAIALGEGSAATAFYGSALGSYSTADGAGAVAVGGGAQANASGAIAIGGATSAGGTSLSGFSTASAPNSIAIGHSSAATASNSIALGSNAVSAGVGAVAVGTSAQADFTNDIAFGTNAHATGDASGLHPSTAFGNGAIASQPYDTAFGALAHASGGQSLALGYGATSSGVSSAAFGTQAEASAKNSVALGGFTYADGDFSTAIGGATASAEKSIAIGDDASAAAAALHGIAIGDNAIVSTARSVALGDASTTAAAVGTTGDTIGGTPYTYVGTTPVGTVSVGSAGSERTITNVAAGRIHADSTDAVNGSQLYATNQQVDTNTGDITANTTRITTNTASISGLQQDALQWSPALGAYDASHGSGSPQKISNVADGVTDNDAVNVSQLKAAQTHYYSVNDGGTQQDNYNNDGATGKNALAAGVGAVAIADSSVAVGHAYAAGTNATALGALSGAWGASSTAVGGGVADATNAIAIGAAAEALNAVGASEATNAIAIGAAAGAFNADSVALGANAQTTTDNSVALGANSVADGSTLGNAAYVPPGATAVAGATPAGEVSVGRAGSERRITHLAAGSADTDAVNVSQLQSVATTANNSVQYDDAGKTSVTLGGTAGTTISNVAPGDLSAASTEAVNGSQLYATNQNVATNTTNIGDLQTTVAKPISFSGNDDTAGPVAAQLGDTVAITGAASTAGTYSGANVKTVTDATTGALSIQIADAPKFGDVTINDGGKITGVTAGTDGTDVVNKSQLDAVSNTANAGWDITTAATGTGVANGTSVANVGPGDTATITAGNNMIATQTGTTVALGVNPVLTGLTSIALTSGPSISSTGIAMGNTKITGLAPGTADTDAVNKSQLDDLSDNAVQYDDATKGSVTLGGTAGTTISNVAPGDLSATSTEAVNGSQLYTTNQNVATNTTNITNLGDTITNIAGDTSTTYTDANGLGIKYARTNDNGLTPSDAFAQGQGSTALGYNATTAAAATNAMALGNGATITFANDVALGAGSVDTRGAQTNYTAYGLAAPQTSVGEVNVGNRQITGVAAGSALTDAVNVSQLTAVVDAASGNAVQYDNTGKTSVTLGGVGSTTPVVLTNVKDGAVNDTSTDAVNGSQLNTTNTNVTNLGNQITTNTTNIATNTTNIAGNTTAITNLGDTITNIAGDTSTTYTDANGVGIRYARTNETGLTASDAFAQGQGSTALGYNATTATTATNAVALGNTARANGVSDIAIGANAAASSTGSDTNVALGANSTADGSTLTTAAYNPGTGALAGVTPVGEVSMGSAGNERRITNVAAGATGTDAVNVSQLQSVVSASAANAVQYDDSTHTTVTLNPGGAGPTAITNVAAGTLSSTSTDAVNGSQLNTTNTNVTNLGNQVSTNTTSIATNTTNIAGNTTAITNLGSTITNIAGDTSTTYTDANGVGIRYARTNEAGLTASDAFAQGQGSTALGYNATTATTATNAVALGNTATANGVSDVAIGANSAASSTGADTNVALGANSVADGSTLATAAYNPGTTALAGTTPVGEISVGSAGNERRITNVAAGANDTDAVNVSQLKSVASDVTNLSDNAVQYDDSSKGSVTLGGTTSTDGGVTGGTTITNVHQGDVSSTSTDAVNGSQLYATNQQVSTNTTNIAGNTTSITNLGNTITNIAGDTSTTYTDANGVGIRYARTNEAGLTASDAFAQGQGSTALGYNATTATTATNAVALGNTATANGVNDIAIGANAAASSTGSDTNVALGANSTATGSTLATAAYNPGTATLAGITPVGEVSVGSAGNERRITNVAAGANDTDAVNVSQLKSVASDVTNLSDNAVQYDDSSKDSVTLAGTLSTDGGVTGGTTITNVHQGDVSSTSTEAVNGSQLYATNQNVTTNTTNISNLTNNVTNGTIGPVQQTGTANQLALVAPSGTGAAPGVAQTLTNVAPGALSSTSTDAVNGSQLNTTNGNVTTNTTNIANNTTAIAGNTTAITNLGSTITNIAGDTSTTYTDANGVGIRYARTNEAGLTTSDAFARGQGSTALGYNATTATTATNAVALGNTATANGADDIAIGSSATVSSTGTDTNVALGANSTATGGTLATAAYNPGTAALAGTTPVGEVSVGSAGSERRITNVAAGANGTDAVNVSQLQSVASDVTNLSDNAVQYDDSTKGSVTLGGTTSTDGGVTGGTTITNVHQGDVSSTSTDVVNGSQLYATNQQVSTNTTNIAGNTTAITNLGSTITNIAGDTSTTYTDANGVGIKYARTNDAGLTPSDAFAQGQGSTALGYNATTVTTATNAVALGNGATANDANAVALGAGSTTAVAVATTGDTIDGVAYTYAGTMPGSTVSVGSAGAERTITNVAAGRISGTSTDAVNGSQLNATNTAVTAVGSKVTNLGDTVASGLGGGSTYNSTTGAVTTSLNYDGNTYNSVQNVFDQINGSVNGGGIKYFHANSTGIDSSAGGTDSVAIGPSSVSTGASSYAAGNGALAVSDDSVAIGHAASADGGSSVSIGAGNSAYGNGAVAIGDPSYASGTGAFTGGANNIANSDGSASATAGNQANGAVAIGNGNKAVGQGSVALGNTSTAGAAGAVAVGDTATASAGNGVAIGSGATATNAGDVALGSGSVTSTAVGVSSATVNGVTFSGFAGANPTSAVSIGSAGNERQLQNVAAGQVTATSTDAVNGSQLYSVANQVGQVSSTVTNLGNQVNQNTTNIAKNTTNITKLQNGSDGMFQVSADDNGNKPVASGTQSTAGGNGAMASGAGSTAVGNAAQATGSNSVAIGANSVASRDNSVSVGSAGSDRQITNVAAGTAQDDAVNVSQLQASQAGNVQYDTNADGTLNRTSVTMDPGGDPTIIHNLGAGIANNDAVNVGQLNQGINTAENWSKTYTDQKFNSINQNLNTIGNRANGGVAAAMAMASLPQAYQPDQSSAAVALGNFHGETGIAVGVSTISESGRYIFKVNATTNTRGDTGVGVGAGIVW
jgi:autotransporter adhesin